MSNYSETVIIPYFQKRMSELNNAITVLEANMLVEQQKNRDLSAELAENSKSKTSVEKTANDQISSLKADLNDKNAKLDDALNINRILSKRVEDLKKVIEGQEKNILSLSEKVESLNAEIASFGSKRKKKEVVLDGSTF
jgi:hypothetical protein